MAKSNGSVGARFTLAEFRAHAVQRRSGDAKAMPMLTCYDHTTARVLASASIRILLVGDSAANVILGYDSTIPAPLEFMIEITAAVRRGAPEAMVMADMPFGSCSTTPTGVRNVVRMVKLSGCDCVKIECSRGHIRLVQALADSGVAVFAHLGLTPQSLGLLGRYQAQGRTAQHAMELFDLAHDLVNAGAAGLLLEATPPAVATMIGQNLDIPLIGCGAGPDCDAHVVVLHDILGLTEKPPRFAPALGELDAALIKAVERYSRDIQSGRYPTSAHAYAMPEKELEQLRRFAEDMGIEL